MRAILMFFIIVRDKDTRQCPQTTTFEEKGEPKRIRPEVPLLTKLRLTARPNRLTGGGEKGDCVYVTLHCHHQMMGDYVYVTLHCHHQMMGNTPLTMYM